MRKDSWFRGALLSALFFVLLWGVAPTALAASVCPDGYVFDAVSESCVPDVSMRDFADDICGIFREGNDATRVGTGIAFFSGLFTGNPGLAGAGAAGWVLNGMINAGCRMAGLGGDD